MYIQANMGSREEREKERQKKESAPICVRKKRALERDTFDPHGRDASRDLLLHSQLGALPIYKYH